MLNGTRKIIVVGLVFCGAWSQVAVAQVKFTPPESPRRVYNFDADWKFFKEDKQTAPTANLETFDDGVWETVSTPHTFNDVDSFRTIISHGGGDRGTWKGTVWYRKHFKLPAGVAGEKVFLEFQGMRQAGDIFLNGKEVGLSENGVTAYGVDISDTVRFGDGENVLAVHVDNSTRYLERATKTGFEWNTNDFNPDHGGINRHVLLHVTGPIHQTLPLYDGLKTTGVYVYPSNISVANKTADITVQSQVQNALADRATAALSVIVVDREGVTRAKFEADPVDMVAGEKTVVEATGALAGAHFWSVDDPYLYDVYTMVMVEGKVVDINKVTTGFRKVEFKGGAGSGGVYINDKFVYLKGFAQRASDEWAGLGQAYPDWMHDLTAGMIRDCHANYVRWMHVTPQKVDVDAYDRAGIIEVAPAGDKEKDAQGRQWEQRKEVMRDSMIYLRNSPSILFWEAGNNGISPEHMQEMVDIRKELDPNGQRAMGCRTLEDPGATPVAEYYGVMIGQDARTDALKTPTALFRAYSAERRDRAPLVETEDFRDEGARRFWDDYSPPHFGFKKGAQDTYEYTSETFALAGVGRYWQYWMNRISNPDPAHAKWSGYASIYFSDSNADGRQDSSEVARVSGKVDAVRLPKEIYFAHRVMQNEQPDIHILGHWTYPAATKKTVYVIANTPAVELFINGKSKGTVTQAKDGFVFAFPDIAFEPGTIKAVGMKGGAAVCNDEHKTAGPAKSIKLTSILGPKGLQADGADVALIDVEVVDAEGQRCPTDEARVDFAVQGPGIWRGGYNSGVTNSTNNLYLSTECGINRVAVRSTLTAGTITVCAMRDGLAAGTVEIQAKAVEMKEGLMRVAMGP